MKKMIFLVLLLVSGTSTFLSADTYYWVGGGGNWNDLTHWSKVSGSILITDRHTELPGADDDVIFNGGSFLSPNEVVNLTIGTSQNICRDMSWTVSSIFSPVLHFPPMSTLEVYGTLSLDADMSVTYADATTARVRMLYNSAGPTKGVFAGGNTLPNVDFAGVGGSWGITGDLTVARQMTLTAGVFKAGGASSQRFNLVADQILINGATAEADLNRLDITTTTQFWVAEVFDFDGDGSTLSTPHLKITTANAVDFGVLNLTGDEAILDAGGYSLIFKGDVTLEADQTTILGSHTYQEDLILDTPGMVVLLEAGATQTLTRRKQLVVNSGGCTGYITLRSTVSGTAANILRVPQNNSDGIAVMRLNIQDIHANNGSAPFTASLSHDLGNNMGIAFTSPSGSTFYWVGGSGNWSDGSHWSIMSGGSGSGCIPTVADNVVFDANSFTANGQTVTVDFPVTYFHDMTWQIPAMVNPEWIIPSGDIYVGGSLTLSPNMNLTVQNTGTVFNFKSDDTVSGETITSAGHDLVNVDFSGSGVWTLQDALTASQTFVITDGQFSTGNHYNLHLSSMLIDGSGVQLFLNDSEIFTTTFTLNDIGDLIEAGSNIYTTTFEVVPAGVQFNELTLRGTNGTLTGTDLIFEDVVLSSSATSQVFGSHTYNGLLQFDNPGMIVEFEAGSIQQVHRINSLGDSCGDQIYVRSTSSGSTFTFQALAGALDPIQVEHIWLQDNVASGTTFLAILSLNLGNVTGWTFVSGPVAQNYYWVGGSGNWSDPDHWSDTPGGDPTGCIPTPNDNVFFTAESDGLMARSPAVWTVTLDQKEQFAHNMTWTGVDEMPFLLLPSGNTLCLFGSLTLSPDMTLDFDGDADAALCFQATDTGNDITTAGHTIPNLVFQGPGGGWNLQDDLTVSGMISVTDGTLNTNGQAVNAPALVVNGAAAGLDLGNSILTLSEKLQILAIGSLMPDFSEIITPLIEESVTDPLTLYEVRMTSDDNETNINADNLIFTNLILTNGIHNVHGSHTFNGGLIFSGSQFSIYNFDQNSTQTINGNLLNTALSDNANPVTAIVQTTPVPASTDDNATFLKTNGVVCLENAQIANITADGGGDGNGAFGYVTATASATDSPGWIASSLATCALFLPVDCVEFVAEVEDDNEVALYWITAQELNNQGFELQRSTDGRRFETIAWIEGAGTTAEPQKYFFRDRDARRWSQVYYRLQQVDYDGAATYACDVLAVSLRLEEPGTLNLYPNPAGDWVRFQYRSAEISATLVRMYDPAGRLILEREWRVTPGDNQLELNVDDLPAGLYEVIMTSVREGLFTSRRLVIK